jgi:hypothetical protein
MEWNSLFNHDETPAIMRVPAMPSDASGDLGFGDSSEPCHQDGGEQG